MKKIFKLNLVLLLGALLFQSCKKDKDLVQPGPQQPPPVASHSFRLVLDSLPGEPKASISNHFAILTVVNTNNETVLAGSKLAISFDGQFKTPELKLSAGNYRITQFWIVNESNQARFATPLVNSAFAIKVSKPLPVSFILPAPAVLNVPLEVAKISAGDTPENFGYPPGVFNTIPGNPNDQNQLINIKLKLSIRVGDIEYGDMPAALTYISWDEKEQPTVSYISMKAGEAAVSVLRKAARHHFRLSKWGQTYELNLSKDEVREGELYKLGGVKQAKKLKSEIVAKLVNGVYVGESKTNFAYGADGKIANIEYLLKRKDGTPYLSKKDVFQYSHGQVEKINRFDENNRETGYTSFSYDGAEKVTGIVERDNNMVTTANVSYYYLPEDGSAGMSFRYTYSNSLPGMQYYQQYQQGNRQADNSHTDNGDTETGRYSFDTNINPYAHIGWPDLYLSNNSRNNITWQEKSYYGRYPSAVAYEFIYKYDGDGYPVELIRHYRSYMTNQFLYTTKTIFSY